MEELEDIASYLHDTYEEWAKIEGWNTQESTKVAFDDLPDTNKRVMLAMAAEVKALISQATKAARIEELNSAVQYWEKHDKLASYYIDRLAALRVASLTKED